MAVSSALILLLTLASCGEKVTPEAKRLVRYLEQIPLMEQNRIGNPLDEWDSTAEGFARQTKNYEHFIRLLKLIQPKSEDLRPLHERFVAANEHRLFAWNDFLGQYEGPELVIRMDSYNQSMADADSLFASFYSELRAKCEEYEVPIPPCLPER
ncbi:MAG: hypothetical protein K8R90_06890 [Candidatus Cloacimonetes bacterium]|nr:hypothetical protein [Candidatus Cloacimonadota bacterium]